MGGEEFEAVQTIHKEFYHQGKQRNGVVMKGKVRSREFFFLKMRTAFFCLFKGMIQKRRKTDAVPLSVKQE